jgi:hypothetical protein
MSVLEPIRSRGSGAAGIVHGNEWSWFNHARYDAAGHLLGRVVSTTPAVAAISGISPSSVNAGGGTFILTVNGSGFISIEVVMW